NHLFLGYGWTPHFIEGDDPQLMHKQMAETLDKCLEEIRAIQQSARDGGPITRGHWPMIVLRSPKGWTGPKEVDGHKIEGFWRSHQVPLSGMHDNASHLEQLESWLRSYRPEELFDQNGGLIPELKALAPKGTKRMSANPHANGGLLRRQLRMPDFKQYCQFVEKPAAASAMNTLPLGELLRDVMANNIDNFRVFGPDENTSNKLHPIYEVSKKLWLADYKPEDEDGGELSVDGRVMEMLSEHTLEGWYEGYVLSGRHGFFATYEAFAHVIDSMYNQHAKWLAICEEIPWRAPISSINLLITSTVWRQDHNGFTHQDPGFIDVVVNKNPEVTRIYLPPDVNTLLSTANHCLRSHDDINVIVCDKQMHLQYLDMDAAIKHCTKGLGIWDWASNDQGSEPDVVLAGCGDIPTKEALAANALLREHFPELKIRFINVVDLFRMTPNSEHPHGLSDR
ncbi:MAG: phosphoketolase family protein, partial [Candidatus Thiodiazotropha sp.]